MFGFFSFFLLVININMDVIQQPISVQQTSFHYRWGALKREASGNLTLLIFPNCGPQRL